MEFLDKKALEVKKEVKGNLDHQENVDVKGIEGKKVNKAYQVIF
jgi:hypothetical protein